MLIQLKDPDKSGSFNLVYISNKKQALIPYKF